MSIRKTTDLVKYYNKCFTNRSYASSYPNYTSTEYLEKVTENDNYDNEPIANKLMVKVPKTASEIEKSNAGQSRYQLTSITKSPLIYRVSVDSQISDMGELQPAQQPTYIQSVPNSPLSYPQRPKTTNTKRKTTTEVPSNLKSKTSQDLMLKSFPSVSNELSKHRKKMIQNCKNFGRFVLTKQSVPAVNSPQLCAISHNKSLTGDIKSEQPKQSGPALSKTQQREFSYNKTRKEANESRNEPSKRVGPSLRKPQQLNFSHSKGHKEATETKRESKRSNSGMIMPQKRDLFYCKSLKEGSETNRDLDTNGNTAYGFWQPKEKAAFTDPCGNLPLLPVKQATVEKCRCSNHAPAGESVVGSRERWRKIDQSREKPRGAEKSREKRCGTKTLDLKEKFVSIRPSSEGSQIECVSRNDERTKVQLVANMPVTNPTSDNDDCASQRSTRTNVNKQYPAAGDTKSAGDSWDFEENGCSWQKQLSPYQL